MYCYLLQTDGSIKFYPINLSLFYELELLNKPNVENCWIFDEKGALVEQAFKQNDKFYYPKVMAFPDDYSQEKYVKILEDFNSMLEYITEEKLNLIFEAPNEVDWNDISENYKLSETFIKNFSNKVDWKLISMYQTLSEEFIEDFQDKVNWELVSWSQTLSEKFIEKYQTKVDWLNISVRQVLSEDFIRKFKDKLNLSQILFSQKLSNQFREELQNELLNSFSKS